MDRAESSTDQGSGDGPAPLHPLLAQQVRQLQSELDSAPAGEAWDRFLDAVDERYRSLEAAPELSHGMRGWSAFENLFHISPTPTMQQDYTGILRWMESLRARGVSDLRTHLGDDIERVREIVPMITVTAANPAAVKAVGLAPDELLGPIDPRIVNDESLPGWLTQLDAVWHGWAVAESAFIAATPDGRRYDCETTLSAPLVDGAPDFTRAVFTVTDVSAHRDEERRMQALVEAKNRFLAAVSHEIRTPLTAVLGFARVLTDGGDLEPDDRTLMISSIAEHAQDVANLVEDLLVAARAESGQVDIARIRFEVGEVIAQTIVLGGSYTQDVTVRQPEGGVFAVGDPSRVRQILRNLLTNAERYGGPNVSIEVSMDGSTAHVDVSDDGPGLPDGDWERIFEPYQTAHETPGRPGSVGIGLAVSRQLAELMGGSLEYHHADGRSVFRLSLGAAQR